MSKSIFLADKNMNAIVMSREEILLKGMANWRGWFCAAGVDNIHITADGNVYAATCKVLGLLCNIYDHFAKFSDSWIKCTKDICACGSDMEIRKVREYSIISLADSLVTEKLKMQDQLKSDIEIVGPVFDKGPRVTITWDLGRRCNYSCSYCNSSISNNFESHKSKGSLEFAYESLKANFLRGRKAKFIFTGGEPTINPAYFDFAKKIHGDGHLIHTQTNGSLTADYYSDLIKFSFIGISVHLQFYVRERLIKNIKAILETRNSSPEFAFQWFGLRIMAPPGRVREAVDLFAEIKSIRESMNVEFELVMSPVYEKNNENQLQAYDTAEFELLGQHV